MWLEYYKNEYNRVIELSIRKKEILDMYKKIFLLGLAGFSLAFGFGVWIA